MTGYVAKFSDGHTATIQNSKKEYGAAYRIAVKWKPRRPNNTDKLDADGYLTTYKTGFSRDKNLAAKAAFSETAVMRRGTYYANRNSDHNNVGHGPGEIIFNEVVEATKV